MPCYTCGQTINEPTEVCNGCGIHLVKKDMRCEDYTECIEDTNDKKCEGCDECITYKGCGTICRITEPTTVEYYTYPNCYCACLYTELRNGFRPIKPNPYYTTCHSCCPIYEMICSVRAPAYEPNPDMRLVGLESHMPPVPFRYDATYEDQLAKDRNYNKEDKMSKSIFHKRVAKKQWTVKDQEWKAKQAQERADRRSEEMSRGVVSYDGNNYNTYRQANNSSGSSNTVPRNTNSGPSPDFSVLRS